MENTDFLHEALNKQVAVDPIVATLFFLIETKYRKSYGLLLFYDTIIGIVRALT